MTSGPTEPASRTLLADAARLGGVFVGSLALGTALAVGLSLIGGEAVLSHLLAAFAGLLAWRSAPGSPALTGLLIFLGNALACGFVLSAGAAGCHLERTVRRRHRLADRVLRRSYARAGVFTTLVPALARVDPSLPRTGLAVSVLVPWLGMVVNGVASGVVIGALSRAGSGGALLPVAAYGPLEVAGLALCGALSPRLCDWGGASSSPARRAPLAIGAFVALAVAASIESAFLATAE